MHLFFAALSEMNYHYMQFTDKKTEAHHSSLIKIIQVTSMGPTFEFRQTEAGAHDLNYCAKLLSVPNCIYPQIIHSA